MNTERKFVGQVSEQPLILDAKNELPALFHIRWHDLARCLRMHAGYTTQRSQEEGHLPYCCETLGGNIIQVY